MKIDQKKVQQYSTWGDKLLQHTDVLRSVQVDKIWRPINVQFAPVEMCDSDCPFCSVAARPLKSFMPWEQVVTTLTAFKELGAKALEISGGGNPLLYRDKKAGKDINDIIRLGGELGFDIGIITNTEKLERHLKPEVYDYINWIRISLIKLDEGKEPEDYDFGSFPPSRMGLSYIIYDENTTGMPDELSRTGRVYQGTNVESIEKMVRLVELHPELKFVRIGGDVLHEDRNKMIIDKHSNVLSAVEANDKLFLKGLDYDEYAFDDGCYVGATRPYIASHPEGGDYQIYICTSHVITHRKYDIDFSLGSVDNVKEIWNNMNISYAEKGYPYEVRGNKNRNWCTSCKTCYYRFNNELLHAVSQPMDPVDRNFA